MADRAGNDSVTEGEDKPLKYLTISNSADVAVITKDLAAAVEFDEAAAKRNIQAGRAWKWYRLKPARGWPSVSSFSISDASVLALL